MLPVLFSRSENSKVFMVAATRLGSKPCSAWCASTSSTTCCTDCIASSSSATPFIPIMKNGWSRSSSSPPPMTCEPRLLSSRALRSGAAGVPISALFSTSHAREDSGSRRPPSLVCSIQLTRTIARPWESGSSPSSSWPTS